MYLLIPIINEMMNTCKLNERVGGSVGVTVCHRTRDVISILPGQKLLFHKIEI